MYMIYSSITRAPYIDGKQRSYLFDTMEAAKEFSEETADTFVRECSGSRREILSTMYSSGACGYIENKDGQEKNLYIKEEQLEPKFYNRRLSQLINRLMQTRDKAYLKNIHKCRFIVPVRVSSYPKVRIMYGTVKRLGSGDYMYLAFTNMDEYNAWREKTSDWEPLLVNLNSIMHIGAKHGFLVNACGVKLVLDKNLLKIISSVEGGDTRSKGK